MVGHGQKCAVVQFIKGAWNTGERSVLEGFGDLVRWHTLGEGFTWETQDKARDMAAAAKAWETAKALMAEPDLKLLVLDELNIALRYDYLPLDEVVETLKGRRPDLHVVVTGRNAKPATDRGGRPRHRDDAGEASLRPRGEGASRHRVLMVARAIMLQGTGSSVGKSLLVTGLARALVRRGISVRPFKPQNMSNNAAVTADGGEIGRAQALQARAAMIAPSVHMNPVLLKPQSEIGAQVIVQGKVFGRATAREMQGLKPKLLPYVLESFARLKSEGRYRAGGRRGQRVGDQS